MRYIILWLLICGIFAENWQNNLDAALQKAQEQNKYVLLYFADENNCRLCSEFKNKVVKRDRFVKVFSTKSVLCALDPRLAQSQKQQQKFTKWFSIFKINEVPTVMMMTNSGKVFFRDVYSGETLKEYSSLLQQILTYQQQYQEFSENLSSQKTMSTAERLFLCKELVESLEKCPEKAWTLRSKFAYLLFYLDKDNITKKRSLAAYTVCLYAKINKQPFLKYLQKDDQGYFEKLIHEFFLDHAQKLTHLYKLVYHNKQLKYQKQLQDYANAIMKTWQQYAFIPQKTEINFHILSLQAICYKSLEDKKNYTATWQKLQQHAQHQNFANLKDLLKH
ncbi:thioredoxin family protein [Candidatus Uabimicrobium sp. HlEnr_7]|uniref:thioredoxin family protein n=1 Tax=Candidatus Uabimicrobium helgolandensis TaxID=3095367 RepID=UPI0035586BE5